VPCVASLLEDQPEGRGELKSLADQNNAAKRKKKDKKPKHGSKLKGNALFKCLPRIKSGKSTTPVKSQSIHNGGWGIVTEKVMRTSLMTTKRPPRDKVGEHERGMSRGSFEGGKKAKVENPKSKRSSSEKKTGL